ncbi:hypothetical protein LCGC14_1051590 [marine sediment metagenome]|uniref:Uncharacterized protein n=1 Tax=marine sediment metagenome TaxID=412755 RepID=A0A0F9QUP3_9ZZZZ
MSLNNYLRENETILHQWNIGPKGEIGAKTGKKVKENILGITNKRVFHFKKLKGYDRIYRDVPLSKISYIENAWHARNLILLVISAIFLIIGLGILVTPGFVGPIIGTPLMLIGLVFLLKGLKQYGYLMINGEDWKFNFNRKEDIKSIEKFIQEIYFIKSE